MSLEKYAEWVSCMKQVVHCSKQKSVLTELCGKLVDERNAIVFEAEKVASAKARAEAMETEEYKTIEENLNIVRNDWIANRDQMFAMKRRADEIYEELKKDPGFRDLSKE